VTWSSRLVVAAWVAGVAVVVVLVGTLVYPAALRSTAPLLCPDGQSDAFVVRQPVDRGELSSVSFSLFCMDDRGALSEVGARRPVLVLCVYAGAVALALALLVHGARLALAGLRDRLGRG
jgi:hypothetical protein